MALAEPIQFSAAVDVVPCPEGEREYARSITGFCAAASLKLGLFPHHVNVFAVTQCPSYTYHYYLAPNGANR